MPRRGTVSKAGGGEGRRARGRERSEKGRGRARVRKRGGKAGGECLTNGERVWYLYKKIGKGEGGGCRTGRICIFGRILSDTRH